MQIGREEQHQVFGFEVNGPLRDEGRQWTPGVAETPGLREPPERPGRLGCGVDPAPRVRSAGPPSRGHGPGLGPHRLLSTPRQGITVFLFMYLLPSLQTMSFSKFRDQVSLAFMPSALPQGSAESYIPAGPPQLHF